MKEHKVIKILFICHERSSNYFAGVTRNGLRLHPNGEHLMYPMGNKITIKHIKTSEQFFLTGHKNFVSALCISPSGELIASGQINHHGFKVIHLRFIKYLCKLFL